MRPPRSSTFYLLLMAGPGLLLLGAAARLLPDGLRPLCITHAATGLPCPSCGSYRALCLFMEGRWLAAWMMQPLMTLVYTALAAASLGAAASWLLRWDVPVKRFPNRRLPVLLAGLGLLALLVNWLYLLAAGR
ncbi:MAG: DUF2752 domain-containing protein [Kiritimatiellia bacterium]